MLLRYDVISVGALQMTEILDGRKDSWLTKQIIIIIK